MFFFQKASAKSALVSAFETESLECDYTTVDQTLFVVPNTKQFYIRKK